MGMFSVFYLDLDGLKKVNDSLGHEAGDEVLCAVSRRLKDAIRKSDTIARIGGDEFAIIVDQIKSEKEAEIAVKKIISSFAKSIQLSIGSVDVGVSIGISIYPVDSNEADELIRLADNSMYTSKNKGRNTYTFYCRDIKTPKMSMA
jgi:diguanylate cyclase (GGDEF)-like protein